MKKKKYTNTNEGKMDKLSKIHSKLTVLEDKLNKLLEREEKRIKCELETIIESSDEIIVDNQIENKQKNKSKIKVNKQYLDKIVSECKEGVFVTDKVGYIKKTNKKVEELLGYLKEDYKDMSIKSLIPAYTDREVKTLSRHSDTSTLYMNLFYGSKKHRSTSIRNPLLDKNKKTIPFLIKATPLKDSYDQLMGGVFLLRNITERENVEYKIKKEKERLEETLETSKGSEIVKRMKKDLDEREVYINSIIESSTEAIAVNDTSGYIKRVNKAFAELFDYPPHELIGKHFAELNPLEEKEYYTSYGEKISVKSKDALEHINSLLSKGRADFEAFLKRKDEKLVAVWASLFFIHNKEGQRTECVAMLRDLTEKKLNEMKLKDSHRKLEEYSKTLEEKVAERTSELNKALSDTAHARDWIDGIVKSVADGLIVTDRYNRIVLMNRTAEDLLGVRFNEVINQTIDFAIQDEILRGQVMSTLDKKRTGYDFELQGNDTKHPRIMRARTSVIYDKEDRQTGIVTIMHDVTQEREIDRMKTEFISTAAHELRTPLTSIQGFSEIMLTRDDISEEDKKRFMTYINKQAVSLSLIVGDLLDIARIESGKGFSLNKVLCNIADIINQVVPYFQGQFPKHHFEVSLPKKPIERHVDKEKMGQVIKNLISNAVKYSPRGGLIRVSGRVSADGFKLSIEDQGFGMTPAQVEKIFDKFYRADASDTAVEGTGLGMTIVKYILEAHGGEIWVESKPGKGTTVRFSIPD